MLLCARYFEAQQFCAPVCTKEQLIYIVSYNETLNVLLFSGLFLHQNVRQKPNKFFLCSEDLLEIGTQIHPGYMLGCFHDPGWKVCQLRTKCQETDKILRTKIEINERTKIKKE